MSVVNIRGTSGSGKSTIVQGIMALYASKTPTTREGRRRPTGYILGRPSEQGPPLFVAGHYEVVCGGCDTIPTVNEVYDLVNTYAERGFDVLFEGLILQSDIKRMIAVSKKYPSTVITLNTPLEDCFRSVIRRRLARGDTRPFNPNNTIAKHESIPSQERRMKAEGVDFRYADREEAFKLVKEILRWS